MLLLYPEAEYYARISKANLHSTMLLLYRISPLAHSILTSIFTFHYASTLSRIAEVVQTSGSNLHSTMLLLYPSTLSCERYWERLAFQHLHSTMLLLYRKSTPININISIIYIPLCFYFIKLWIRYPASNRQIYIPLCFYFISAHYIQLRRNSPFTFHYASTLSKWIRDSCGRSESIYIPLCFYFIDQPVSLRITGFYIYIPLCFYFIRDLEEWIATYYYLHSTMLLLYRSTGMIKQCCSSSFTFHYASTLSPGRRLAPFSFIDLHSTMLLLYLSASTWMTAGYRIYIPLCFYFMFMSEVKSP